MKTRRISRLAIPLVLLSLTGCSCLWKTQLPAESPQSNGESLYPSVSYDGRYVAFVSAASNLVEDDRNEVADVFVRDVRAGVTTRVSVNSYGNEGDLESTFGSISGEGRFVVFTSSATNLVSGDTNQRPDVFVHDRKTATTTRVSVGVDGRQGSAASYTYFPAISADGAVVAFTSMSGDLVEGDGNGMPDVFFHDRVTGRTRLISVGPNGEPANGPSLHAVISGNGRFVAFHSMADNLVEGGDDNGASDVFVFDRESNKSERVSVGPYGAETFGASHRAAISHDGLVVAFSSDAPSLDSRDRNDSEDVFVRDLETGAVEVASLGIHGTTPSARLDTGDVICCLVSTACCVIVIIQDRKSVVSPDGQHVLYRSDAAEVVEGDGNFLQDIFIYDRATKATERISVGVDGSEANRESVHHGVSFDGRLVVFSSEASNLTPDDRNGHSDIFLRDRETQTTTLVSVALGQRRKPTKSGGRGY